MSTKNTTTSSAQFDPGSMGVFQGLTSTYGSAIQDMIKNPYSNMFFNQQLGMQNQAQHSMFASEDQAALQRAQALGIDPKSPLFSSMMDQRRRGQMGQQSDSFNQLLLQAAQLRQGAIGQAGAYRPMQTGSTEVKQQSGLGTWLPQLISGGIGAAAGIASGGATFAGKAAGGAMGGAKGGFGLGGGYNFGDSQTAPGQGNPFLSGFSQVG